MKLVPIVACMVASAALARALPGDLDVTFGAGGKVISDFGRHSVVTALAVQQDGKILAAGNFGFGDSFILARYQEDGTLDSSFGNGGSVFTAFSDLDGIDSLCTGMAIDSNGRIVLAGKVGTYFGYDFVVARYDPNGTLDATFGTAGAVITHLAGGEGAEGLLIQPDGKLVLTGLRGGFPRDMVLIRHNPDGTLDESFGHDGIASARFAYGFDPASGSGAAALQKDGKIVVAGSVNQEAMVARFNADGTLDKPFSKNGAPLAPVSRAKFTDPVIALEADGTVVVAGTTYDRYADDPNGVAGWFRFIDTGERLGYAEYLPALTTANALAIDQWGGILVAGNVVRDGLPRFAVARFNKGESADLTFGKRGRVITSFGYRFDSASSIAIQADGKIIVAGGTPLPGSDRGGFVLARYSGDHIQPDLRVGLRANVGVGNDVYTQQAKWLYARPDGGVGKAFIGIQNDGTVADSFMVKGSRGNSAFGVKYFRGTKDVTESVVAGTYNTGKLEPGAIRHLKIQITAVTKVDSKWREFLIAAVSDKHPAAKDLIHVSVIAHQGKF